MIDAIKELMGKVVTTLMEKGFKELLRILINISFIALFISPSFVFLYLYDNSIFKWDNLFVGVTMMIVISSILFLILFVLSTIILPFKSMILKKENNNTNNMINYTVIITLIFMGIISIVPIVTYYWNENVSNNIAIRNGVRALIIILLVLLLIWIIPILNIVCNKLWVFYFKIKHKIRKWKDKRS